MNMGREGRRGRFALRYDPLRVFTGSRSPEGLYARQKWGSEAATGLWRQDFHEAVSSLLRGQSADGSWGNGTQETIRRLFGLHLTVRDFTAEVARALDWLIGTTLCGEHVSGAGDVGMTPESIWRGLPFTPGDQRFCEVCATLFLAVVFDRSDDADVAANFNLLLRRVLEEPESLKSWKDKNNALRALIVHPRYSEGAAASFLIDQLNQVQESSGAWSIPVPASHLLNILGHSRFQSADRQWTKAFRMVCETQNQDGSWGQNDTEWHTFLIVHALKKRECL